MTKRFLLLMVLLAFILSGVSFVQAQDKDYTVLAPLPGTTLPGDDTKADLTSYIPGVFKLIIGLASVIAVAYIIFGGFKYITTDAILGKEEGKKLIQNAIYGLFMVSIAWLILYTINPRILTFDLNISALSVPSGPPGTLGSCPTCAAVDRSLPLKSGIGTTIDPTVNSNLLAMQGALGSRFGWEITEAFPPTGTHAPGSCHYSGTCVDAALLPRPSTPSTDAASRINAFLRSARNNGFPRTVFEVRTPEEVTAWRNVGVIATPNANLTGGSHFHVQ
jgi:hypothetical protein